MDISSNLTNVFCPPRRKRRGHSGEGMLGRHVENTRNETGSGDTEPKLELSHVFHLSAVPRSCGASINVVYWQRHLVPATARNINCQSVYAPRTHYSVPHQIRAFAPYSHVFMWLRDSSVLVVWLSRRSCSPVFSLARPGFDFLIGGPRCHNLSFKSPMSCLCFDFTTCRPLVLAVSDNCLIAYLRNTVPQGCLKTCTC